MGIVRDEPELYGFSSINGNSLGLSDGDGLHIAALARSLQLVVEIILVQNIGGHTGIIDRSVQIVSRQIAVRRVRGCRDIIRVFRQSSIANDSGLTGIVVKLLHAVSHVAFHGLETRTVFADFCHEPDVICRSVRVIVKKYNIALDRGIITGTPVKPGIRQTCCPRGAVISIRNGSLRDSGITQAEGHEHGIPVTIGISIPLAEAGNALHFAGFGHHVVSCALRITKLGLCNGNQIVSPVARQICFRDAAAPYRRTLNICIRIGVADKGMLVFFFLTNQGFLIAGIFMNMAFRPFRSGNLILSTGQNALFLITCLCVRMTYGFFLSTDQITICVIAVIPMCMPGRFALTAGENLLCRVAIICVCMGRCDRCGFSFFQSADQHLFIAFVRMLMGFFPAIGVARHGKRRKNQRIGRAEHNDAGQYGHDLLPTFFTQMFF